MHILRLNKQVKKSVVDGEQEFSFSTFAARFEFPNLFLVFLLILKRFWAAVKFNVYNNITATSISVGRSKHHIFYFFCEKSPASVVKESAAIGSQLLFWTLGLLLVLSLAYIVV